MIKLKNLVLALCLTLFAASNVFATLNIVELNPQYFPDPTIGRPISNADIYVGEPDLDPEVVVNQKQISIQQEDGSVIEVSQPISTGTGGVPIYAGSPVTILVDGNYSLKVLNRYGSQLYYIPSTADFNTDIVISVETLADLQVTNQEEYKAIKLLGRTVVGDGGGGAFYWDSSDLSTEVTTDTQSGRYIAPNSDPTGASGAWVRLGSDSNIRQYGAIEGGSIDCYTAIQAYSDNLSNGDTFIIPEGDWLISATVTIANDINIHMDGYIVADFGNAPALDITVTISTKDVYFRIRKNAPSVWTTDTSTGVRFTGSIEKSIITVFDIRDFYRGIFFDYTGTNYAAWNDFYIKRIVNCKRAVEIYLQASGTWWNENIFRSFSARADSGNNTGLDFYGIYAHADGYYSFNRNVLLYPAFEGARMIGLYAEKTHGWSVIEPRNESITAGRSVQLVNCLNNNTVAAGVFTKLEGVDPSLIDISFTTDISNQPSAAAVPAIADDFNKFPIFKLSDLIVDSGANTMDPFVWATVGPGSGTPTFSYNKGLPAGAAAKWSKADGGYNYTYEAAGSKIGVLIDLQGASLISIYPSASALRSRLVFLDSAQNLVFNSVSDTTIRGENFAAQNFYWVANYGFFSSADITVNPQHVWVNSSVVKYVMIQVAAKSSFVGEFMVYTDSPTSKLIY